MELYQTTYPCYMPSDHFNRLFRTLRRLWVRVAGLQDSVSRIATGENGGYSASNRRDSHVDANAYFLELTGRYDQLVNRICLSYADCSEDFEDLRQDVWINVWKSLDGFREDSSLDTWIYRITLNTCVSCLRKSKRNVLTSPIDGIFPEPADEDGSDTFRERLRILHHLISRLSPLDKAIMTMHLDDRSNAEIAEVTGLSKGNVATRLSRIKNRMTSEINR